MTTKPLQRSCSEYIYEPRGGRHLCGNSGTVLRDGKYFCGTHDPVKVAAREEEKLRCFRAINDRKHAVLVAKNKVVEAAQSAAGTWCFNYQSGVNVECGSCRGCKLNAALVELKTAEENRFK